VILFQSVFNVLVCLPSVMFNLFFTLIIDWNKCKNCKNNCEKSLKTVKSVKTVKTVKKIIEN
jgi:hypothetical protein